MEFTVNQISAIIGGEVVGDGNQKVSQINGIEDAKKGAISFLSNPKYEPFVYTTEASAVIVSKDFTPAKDVKATLIKVDNPYLSFTSLLEEYEKISSFQKNGIEQPVFIGDKSSYGDNVYLGAFSYIGENVKIGDNVKIHPQVYIGDNTTIGNNCIFHPGVKIYAGTKIGSFCTFHSGVVIGSDGFGFAPQENGSYKKIPQLGNVIIEDHVDIGANTTVDCATFESTIIRKGVKLDNLVMIAHNVEIGENTVMAGQSGISGSTKVGKQVIIAGQVGSVGHIKIGDGSILAAQSGISKNVGEGETMFGSPAFEKGAFMRSYTVFRKLPDVMKRIQELEQKILNLSSIKK
ncbi:MAG: UDP-3-O-(3-hydroxymyristoyl)glucosamine N-acyltransferase [Bacteroidota bacterium]